MENCCATFFIASDLFLFVKKFDSKLCKANHRLILIRFALLINVFHQSIFIEIPFWKPFMKRYALKIIAISDINHLYKTMQPCENCFSPCFQCIALSMNIYATGKEMNLRHCDYNKSYCLRLCYCFTGLWHRFI